MSVQVKEINIDGNISFRATLRLICGAIITVVSASAEAAIQDAEEEARCRANHNPNQGVNFDEEEEDYYC